MRSPALLQDLRVALVRAGSGSGRKGVLDRFRHMVEELTRQEASDATPERTRNKITALLDHVEGAYEELGSRLFHISFALNVVGEGMARADIVHQEVVGFLQVGLYFFGLDQIERRWPSRATVYSGVHADHLGDFLGRKSLKDLMASARTRLSQGRVFCLTYAYLNSLRKAYWSLCRASEDALDVALTGENLSDTKVQAVAAPAPQEAIDPSDRVALMLRIFGDCLTGQQRWVYLAKNRSGLFSAGDLERDLDGETLAGLLGDVAPPGQDLGWAEIASRIGVNEKTAKREYLRTLHVLLKESADAVFGADRIPSRYVRRILEQIRSIVYEKDLRIRSSTGRGLNTLVEKWEVALRYVLNHERIVA